jgi:hypothetical protein
MNKQCSVIHHELIPWDSHVFSIRISKQIFWANDMFLRVQNHHLCRLSISSRYQLAVDFFSTNAVDIRWTRAIKQLRTISPPPCGCSHSNTSTGLALLVPGRIHYHHAIVLKQYMHQMKAQHFYRCDPVVKISYLISLHRIVFIKNVGYASSTAQSGGGSFKDGTL